MNAQQQGQATVTKAEAARGQTTINQKVAAKMLKILLGLCYMLNITKRTVVEAEAVAAVEGAGGRGQRYLQPWRQYRQGWH